MWTSAVSSRSTPRNKQCLRRTAGPGDAMEASPPSPLGLKYFCFGSPWSGRSGLVPQVRPEVESLIFVCLTACSLSHVRHLKNGACKKVVFWSICQLQNYFDIILCKTYQSILILIFFIIILLLYKRNFYQEAQL